jgi:protein kinase-like protein
MRRAPREKTAFGPYLLLERMCEGGVAELWRARRQDAPQAAELVVKTLHPRLFGQPMFADLFAAEARVTRLLSHPGIVRVVDYGTVKRVPYVAMERVDGCDLATVLRGLPDGMRMAADLAVTIALELCRALGHAHLWRDKRGKPRPLAHGDLSPSNVMLRRDGGVTLIDFGAAQVNRHDAAVVIGKSGYLAPELLDQAAPDARSDVFAVGVILHELLVGRPLFAVESQRETLRRLTEAHVAPPSQSNRHVTEPLDAIVLRALDRDPRRRFASANDMADALEWLSSTGLASRKRVAALVRPLLDGAAPSPSVVQTAWDGSTATINQRRRLRAAADAPPAPRRRTRRRGFMYALLATTAAAAVLLAPMPRSGSLSMAALSSVKLPSVSMHRVLGVIDAVLVAAGNDTPPPPPAVEPAPPPAPAPSTPPPVTTAPKAAATETPRTALKPRPRRHTRHTRVARLERGVVTGRLVDPLRSR